MVVFVPQIIPIDAFLLPEFGTETGLGLCQCRRQRFVVKTNRAFFRDVTARDGHMTSRKGPSSRSRVRLGGTIIKQHPWKQQLATLGRCSPARRAELTVHRPSLGPGHSARLAR